MPAIASTGAATRAADAAFHALVVEALGQYGRPDDAGDVADTLIAASKGLMRSGELHVSRAIFSERLDRLVSWLTD